jgi:hypothetical protein
MITIKIRDDKRRLWEFYLRKKYGSKKRLETLVEYLVLETVSEEAKKHLVELGSATST